MYRNKNQIYDMHFFVDKPSVSLNNTYAKPGDEVTIICECAGYPESKITWAFTPCSITPVWPNCNNNARAAAPNDVNS